jgi:hypothetical protein
MKNRDRALDTGVLVGAVLLAAGLAGVSVWLIYAFGLGCGIGSR